MKIIYLAAASLAIFATQAEARIYVLKANATVSHLGLLRDGVNIPLIGGQFDTGDELDVLVRFDTEKAVVADVFDADPSINMYDLNELSVSISIGAYRSPFTGYVYDKFLSLWDNRVNSGPPTDSQSFTLDQFDVPSGGPFNLGAGRSLEMLTLYAFDRSGLSRNSDLISELVGSSDQFSNSMTYSFSVNPTDGPRYQIVALTNNVTWTLAPQGVPEPATWALLVGGFFLVGSVVRRGCALNPKFAAESH